MKRTAKITKNITHGFSEILLSPEDWKCDANCTDCEMSCPFDEKDGLRVIADEGGLDVRRDDIVLVEKAAGQNIKAANIVYIMVPLMFLLGYFLGKALGQSQTDMLVTGGIFALLNFILAWLMNRKVRMRRRMEYRITKLVYKASQDIL